MLDSLSLHVWSLIPAGEDLAAEVAVLADLVDPETRARVARLGGPVEQWSVAAAHALLRGMLSRLAVAPGEAPVPPPAWRLAREDHGRPFLAGPAPVPPALFSLTHTRNLAACALILGPDALRMSLGIDAEAPGRQRDPLPLARRFCHPREAAALAALPAPRRPEAFLGLWTLKEAVAKASGRGLQIGLASFQVEQDPPLLRETGPLPGPPEAWMLVPLEAPPGAALTVACHAPGLAPTILRRALIGTEGLREALTCSREPRSSSTGIDQTKRAQQNGQDQIIN
ncbi:4'-phosphopantetheinyl transferase family protein [Pararhodospirillum oryzae]|uniref:4'-phosphopantetheinyl transferase domain-containing protein n=1 Tax=Pararhodospirillum oryzae TaxID=478448 RepID=A0A512H8A3_9PROT|nr:4'-phosphopantetheinyl transferase superfamily protein [Pararhodospirillum oryzae]GEO81677.1 hypothetical protein ROR02_18080 [Pararhodospirillum oryzae]